MRMNSGGAMGMGKLLFHYLTEVAHLERVCFMC